MGNSPFRETRGVPSQFANYVVWREEEKGSGASLASLTGSVVGFSTSYERRVSGDALASWFAPTEGPTDLGSGRRCGVR